MTGVTVIVAAGLYTPPLVVSASPSSPYQSRVGTGTVTSPVVTASASGGTGPYTYAWSFVSGVPLTASNPSAAATTFSSTVVTGTRKDAVYRVTATDSLSATATFDVSVGLEAF